MDQCGALRTRAELFEPVTEMDGQSNTVTRYRYAGSVWVDVRDMSGREFYAQGAHQAETIRTFKLRFRPGLHTGMHIRCDGMDYDILHVQRITGQRPGYMLLRARETHGEDDAYGTDYHGRD